jgi:hypothetical protein
MLFKPLQAEEFGANRLFKVSEVDGGWYFWSPLNVALHPNTVNSTSRNCAPPVGSVDSLFGAARIDLD